MAAQIVHLVIAGNSVEIPHGLLSKQVLHSRPVPHEQHQGSVILSNWISSLVQQISLLKLLFLAGEIIVKSLKFIIIKTCNRNNRKGLCDS